jgi:hypothetical protein
MPEITNVNVVYAPPNWGWSNYRTQKDRFTKLRESRDELRAAADRAEAAYTAALGASVGISVGTIVRRAGDDGGEVYCVTDFGAWERPDSGKVEVFVRAAKQLPSGNFSRSRSNIVNLYSDWELAPEWRE